MSYIWGRAFNRLTGESMSKPQRPSMFEYEHLSEWLPAHYQYISDMKKWDAFIAELPSTYTYERPKLKHAQEKGIPVARTGSRRWHSGKNSGKAGVIGNSRVLPHRYMDEGDKGKAHNRHIKRVERAQWRAEWEQEQQETEYYGYTVEEYYCDDDYDEWDDYDESPYGDDYCETCHGPCEL